MPSHFTDKQMGTHPRLPSQEQRPHCTLPSWPPLQGKPANQKGFVKPLHLVRLGAWTQRHHPPVQSETRALNQPGWKPATKDVCSVPLICGPGFCFFFFFVHPQSGLGQLCFSRIIPVPHPLHSSGRLVVGDPNQAPSPGPLPLEDERSWVSRTPAHPTVHAGAASCLQGWAPVSMAAAGGAPPGD